jgi:hypothetical protein
LSSVKQTERKIAQSAQRLFHGEHREKIKRNFSKNSVNFVLKY